MLFNSFQFLVFFPLVCCIYYLIPDRLRYIFLLVCSYYFYMCWNPQYAILIFASTLITWLSGLLLDRADRIEDEATRVRRKKLYVALSFLSNLGILFFFKYYVFTVDTITRLFSMIHVQIQFPVIDVILPVGISFYTFQALSYTVDVYRHDIYAEKNFLKYALFVSFFPQLVAGPIERSKNLLTQLSVKHEFDPENVRKGLLLMMFGFFQKVVLAERLSIVVDTTYNFWQDRTGFQLLVASILFAFQIYCDFGGYSNIAIGAAKVMGFRLMDNFDTPYFSLSVAEFWRRWHISLSSWFRDYLYIPLGGSRKGQFRKQLNRMIVFFVSGLWHGASWHYVIWGCMNGAYQVIGDYLMPARKRIRSFLHIKEEMLWYRFFRMVITFGLIDASWIFFRATFRQSLHIIKRIVWIRNGWGSLSGNLPGWGLDEAGLIILLLALLILLLSDVARYRKIDLIDVLTRQKIWIRWPLYCLFVVGILLFGIYGPGFDAGQFIYFQF